MHPDSILSQLIRAGFFLPEKGKRSGVRWKTTGNRNSRCTLIQYFPSSFGVDFFCLKKGNVPDARRLQLSLWHSIRVGKAFGESRCRCFSKTLPKCLRPDRERLNAMGDRSVEGIATASPQPLEDIGRIGNAGNRLRFGESRYGFKISLH